MSTQFKTSRLVRKIAKASREELFFRGKQFAWNRSERLRYQLGLGALAESNWIRIPNFSAGAGCFFFSSKDLDGIVRTLRSRFPEVSDQTIDRAERICSHRFDLLGYHDLDLGPRINWHLDPVHGKEASRKPSFKIPYLEFDAVGDSKITWELNRHQHFITLGKAYQLTRNEKYAAEFSKEFYEWMDQNPYLIGLNWASSLEVALRSLSWFWAKELFHGSRALSKRLERDLTLALARNARFIEHNLSTYFSPNTHLLGEAVALFFSGLLCRDLRRAPEWLQTGLQIILQEADRQVRSDGGYFEQATHYHTYAVDLLLHARILARRNGIPIPENLDCTIVNMLDYLTAISWFGPTSRLGDDDGGRLFDPSRNRAEHLADPLSTGAALYHRSDWKSASRGLIEETCWLLGSSAAAEFDALPDKCEPVSSKAFPASGIYSMASNELRLTADAGPFGAGHSGHAHSDALGITITADGREWLTDRGTFTYTGSAKWRNLFRGAAAHNTVRIDGLDQADAVAPFEWGNIPQVRVEHWWSGPSFDLLVASHSGYRRLPFPATHRRLAFFVKPLCWFVIDSVEGEGEHEIEVFWHAPTGEVEMSETVFEIRGAKGERFGVVPLADPDWSRELVGDWHSASYGHKEAAQTLRCSARTSLPAEYAAVLIPRLTESLPRFERISRTASHGNPRGFRYFSGSHQHSWVFADDRQSWQLDEVESDARFAYLEQDAKGRPCRAFLWDGSFLSVNRANVVRLPALREYFEQVWPESDDSSRENGFQEAGAFVSGPQGQAH